MLGKTLEIIGIIISVAGLVRDERLTQWENRIRSAIGRATNLTWARKILRWIGDWFTRLRNAIFHNENLIAAFITAVIVIAGIVSVLVNSYFEGQNQLMLHEAQKQDPTSYERSQLYVLVFAVALLGILLLADKLGGILRKYAPFLYRFFAAIGKLLRWLGRAYITVTFSVVFGIVAIVLISPLALLLLGGFIMMIGLVSLLMIGFFLVRLTLLPYQILDLLTIRLEFKSTVLFIGIIFTLVGRLLQ
jgi:hypothetical protein